MIGGVSTPLTLAVIGALLALATNWLMKFREEARLGGAAERRLRAEFQNASDVLRASKGEADETWLSPGLRIPVWKDQFDRLVPRFLPAEWDRLNGAVDALDRLQGQVETATQPGEPVTKTVDAADVAGTQATVTQILDTLNTRQYAWQKKRPWLNESGPPRQYWWVLGVTLFAGAVSLLAIPGRDLITADDHTDAAAMERELREMEPGAEFVNCVGDDAVNRWLCKVGTTACQTASVQPTSCAGEVAAVVDVEAEADGNTEDATVSLTRMALNRANAPKRPTTGEQLRGWVRNISRREPRVDLTAAPAGG